MLAPVVLWGIAAGASVFVATIAVAFFLLQHGGSFDRIRSEAAGMPAVLGELKPLLYDALLDKARTMALRPAPLGTAAALKGDFVVVRDFAAAADVDTLFRISSGAPQYVMLVLLWVLKWRLLMMCVCRGGIYRDLKFDADEMVWKYLTHGPFDTLSDFKAHYCDQQMPNARHFVLVS